MEGPAQPQHSPQPQPPPGRPASLLPQAAAEPLAAPRSLLQNPAFQNIAPLLTSIVLHAALVILGFLTFKAVQEYVAPLVREQIIIPEAEMVSDRGPEGGIPHPGLGGDPTRDAAQDQFPDVPKESKGVAEKPGPALQVSLMGGGGGEGESSGLIGIGPGGLGTGRGVGRGIGDGLGAGGEGSGQLAPFGVPGGGGGIGPKSNFIGLGGNAKRIAYVCDASGSMLEMFDWLRLELRRSIESLKPIQSFNVIFFQGEGTAAADKNSLMVANQSSKVRAYEFIDATYPRDKTNPLPSLELAFRQNPELIYMLTDGEFPDNDAVIRFCRQKTADGKCKINTIAFVTSTAKERAIDLEYVKVLKRIADDSGGQFRYVSDDDMGR